MLSAIVDRARELLERLKELGDALDLETKRRQIAELEEQVNQPDFWNDPQNAAQVTKKLGALRSEVERFENLQQRLRSIVELAELAMEESDESVLPDLERELAEAEKIFRQVEISVLLSGEHDRSNAILSITPGAGGTDAQDWAAMLARMYQRWAQRHGFDFEILDYSEGKEAGIKSFTALVKGDYAYGLLKTERGVHRLVRISPFDADKSRHTSFAAVDVIPEIGEDIKVDIREEDLEIETFRSSGPGGQHMQKNETAVRITHKPTGIVVTCQSERSQHRNKEVALQILKARLYELERRKREEELAKLRGELPEISFGSQIRSYVLHPYKLVKDLRTEVETSDVESVLDGDLDEFIYAALKQEAAKKTTATVSEGASEKRSKP
ncbi:peptide chain release factor 2 [Fervidibacter sacchari]|uniref:peptide chain release factor 2 n=1 Tax=Candidatus Fervidibacter sacchari TaxID=1448929 RepID=UPI00216A12F7|nr:peptide chain release factor 2 [Candidatus Fervidibacter sacchari]WKU15860.1 peptide chain release factor 2 [Candidatus Fervidibacter sacchari]